MGFCSLRGLDVSVGHVFRPVVDRTASDIAAGPPAARVSITGCGGRRRSDCSPASRPCAAARARAARPAPRPRRGRARPMRGRAPSGSRRRPRCSARCAGHARGTARRDRAGRLPGAGAPRPAIKPSAAAHGAMWIMLIETTASARVTGQTGAVASSSSGGSRFGESGRGRMRRDAGAGLRVGIGRLPDEMGQGGGEMDGVLAAAAGDLQHGSRRGQHVPQYRQDRIAVARHGGRGQGAVKRSRHESNSSLAPIRRRPS